MGEPSFVHPGKLLPNERYTDAVFSVGCSKTLTEQEVSTLPTTYKGIRLFYKLEPRLCMEPAPTCWDYSEPKLNAMTCEWHCPGVFNQSIGFMFGLASSSALALSISTVLLISLCIVKRNIDKQRAQVNAEGHQKLKDDHL